MRFTYVWNMSLSALFCDVRELKVELNLWLTSLMPWWINVVVVFAPPCHPQRHGVCMKMQVFVCVCVTALDQRLQQLSARNTDVTPRSNLHLLDQLTAQQEKNQMALLQLQQQMQALNKPRFKINYLVLLFTQLLIIPLLHQCCWFAIRKGILLKILLQITTQVSS